MSAEDEVVETNDFLYKGFKNSLSLLLMVLITNNLNYINILSQHTVVLNTPDQPLIETDIAK